MKHKVLNIILCVAMSVCLAACGSKDSFTVSATIDGLGTQNVRAVYRTGSKLNTLSIIALDGKFRFTGNSPQPTMVYLYSTAKAPVGSFIARNGDDIEVTFKLNEPATMTAKGSDESSALAKFRKENAEAINMGDGEAINEAVEKYVATHKDGSATGFIIMMHYDASLNPAMADSLLGMVSQEVRPGNDVLTSYRETLGALQDTLTTYHPLRLYTTGDSTTALTTDGKRRLLLAFSGRQDVMPHEALVKRLNILHDAMSKRARIVEISIVSDTVTWKRQITDEKPKYTRCWEPGGTASPAFENINVTRTPWYIAVDSTDSVIYNGESLDSAEIKLKDYAR